MAEHSASHRETQFTWQRRSPAIQRTVHKELWYWQGRRLGIRSTTSKRRLLNMKLGSHQKVNCGWAWKKSTNSPLREITAFTSLSRILTTKPIMRFMLILRLLMGRIIKSLWKISKLLTLSLHWETLWPTLMGGSLVRRTRTRIRGTTTALKRKREADGSAHAVKCIWPGF